MGVRKRQNGTGVGSSGVGRSCVASRLPSQVATGMPSKDAKPRAGASRDPQSCVASSLLRQAVDTGGQSQWPVDSHRARAVRQPQSRVPFAFLFPRRQLGHSPPPQGK